MTVALVILGGGLGGLARYTLTDLVQRRVGSGWPWGTTVVNVCGAGAFGVLLGLHAAGVVGQDAVVVAGTGFFGGFTTFSTWMVEAVRLAEDGPGRAGALVHLAGMAVVGVAAASIGLWLAG